MRGGEVAGAGVEEALRRGGELSVFDGGAVASPIDGVHDRQSAAYAEDEAEEEADERAGVEVHDLDRMPWRLMTMAEVCLSPYKFSLPA
jgi:hypothetical protein